jgi:hypothetical protein
MNYQLGIVIRSFKVLALVAGSTFLFSCEQNQDTEEEVTPPTPPSQLNFAESRMSLQGKAAQIVTAWNEYQVFKTAFEEFNQTPESTLLLYDYATAMAFNIPEELNNAKFKSRIKLLRTRLGIYNSYINYNEVKDSLRLKKYADVVDAWDELNHHFNDQINEIDRQRDALKQLLLSENRNDSIARARRDSLLLRQE